MRKDRLLRLADRLELTRNRRDGMPCPPDHNELLFNMGEYLHQSWQGTTGCIAGRARIMSQEDTEEFPHDNNPDEHPVMAIARQYLDLTQEEAKNLFAPSKYLGTLIRRSLTAQQAAQTVRRLAETGKIDWSITGVG